MEQRDTRVPRCRAPSQRARYCLMNRTTSRVGSPCPSSRRCPPSRRPEPGHRMGFVAFDFPAERERARHAKARTPGPARPRPAPPGCGPAVRGGRQAPEPGGWFYEWERLPVAAPARSRGHSLPPPPSGLRRCSLSAAAAAGRAVGEARAPWVRTRQKEGLAAQPAQPTELQAGVKQTHIRSHLLKNAVNIEVSPPPLLQVSVAPNKDGAGSVAQGL